MKVLTEYTKNGHRFTQYCRAGNLAIFHGRAIKGKSETWEVIHIMSHNGREIGGKFCEPAEFPPSNEQWGSRGWSYTNPDGARSRFEVEIGKEMAKPATEKDIVAMVTETKEEIFRLA